MMKSFIRHGMRWAIALLGSGLPLANAEQVNVAVAANFSAPMQEIAIAFQQTTGHEALLSLGATGKLYAQIVHGAPFGLLLSADDTTPQRLIAEKRADPQSLFTYASGKLVLWSADAALVDNKGEILTSNRFRHLAIANPDSAPYGRAAIATLKHLMLLEHVQTKLVLGESITQAYQFVGTGNAELGFIALSQVFHDGNITSGSAWMIPADYYPPLHQDAVLLNAGQHNPAAIALLAFLRSPAAQAIIHAYGYDI